MIFGRRTSVNEAEEQWKGEKCSRTMRQSFHRALTTCRAPLPPGKKYVAVQFLTKERIFYVVDTKGKGQDVFEEATKHLNTQDVELFGLAFYQDGDYIFIDLNLKVSKYAVRSWKTHNYGIGNDGQPLLILHMRIRYYVDCHLLISEKVVRHHYYLQLRENVKTYSQALSEEKSFLLAALALQADLGNYQQEKHKNRYFEIKNYFPSWIIGKLGEAFIIRFIPALHKDNAGLSRGEAQVGYIKEASEMTAPHNLHFYRMKRKKGKVWNCVWLGIRASGIHIYEQQEPENVKSLLSTFLWCDIAKLQFEKKKFEIISEGSPEYRRFTYLVQREELAKYLLWICRTTHHFHMANQSRVADLKKLELEGGKPYREAYIYTDKMDQALEKKQNTFQKSKLENSSINLNGTTENLLTEKSLKSVSTKMSGMSWSPVALLEGCRVDGHHSMETLPLLNGCQLSTEIKYKSQSISCFSDRSLTPVKVNGSPSHLWNPVFGSASTTPTSTLMSRSSCASNSTCSSLSLVSGSTIKAGNSWLKCDSFEELPVKEKTLHKMCISTFMDKHVRTASVYDAVTYATSSLETPASKRSEVKRTPSLGNQRTCIAQKPHRHYAQMASRGRTRIGVSSLSRDQRLPPESRICGSEPNLYVPPRLDPTPSRSEINLNAVGNSKQSLPDICNDLLENADFPCIPPPPAYRNDEGSPPLMLTSQVLSSGLSPQILDAHPDLRSTQSSPPDVLDMQQLRQRSRDLDLPLISALCNDRSLLMLPKTVPTCSRQRHLGSKDPLRFNRATSLPNGDNADTLLPNSRPISWHVDSGFVLNWHETSRKPCSASWDNGIKSHPQYPVIVPTTSNLPSTILTSFGKTPVKPIRSIQESCSSDSYRLNKNQMIPIKLLAGSLGATPNGRLYHKGSSS